MARLFVSCTVPAAGLDVNTTTKTIVQLLAPSNQRIAVHRFSFGSGGTVDTTLSLIIQSTTGTMTSGTPVAEAGATETPQVTFTHSASAEPTTTSVIGAYRFQGGIAVDLGDKPIILGGGQRLGFVLTTGGTANFDGSVYIEE